LREFEPLFSNAHLATLAASFWPRAIDEQHYPTRPVIYDTEPGTRILVHENRPAGPVRGEVIIHHGLEGSSASGYMISLAQEMASAGYAAHRLNMRSCGGTEHLTPTLYHSGLTVDVRTLAERFIAEGRGPIFLVGYSLGGNLVLKLAGELGDAARGLLAGVVAVSTPLDLYACVLRLGAPENRLYEMRFVRSLKARYRRRHAQYPEAFPIDGLERVKTVYEFDDHFTSRAFGFGSALNYYRTQSSIGFLDGIRVPTLLVQAQDDPMIPFDLFNRAVVRKQPHLRLLAPVHGGHVGFVARHRPRFWVDQIVRDWCEEVRNKALPVIV